MMPTKNNSRAALAACTAGAALLAAGAAPAQTQFTPLRPPSVPLITRTPYVSEWLQSDQAPGTWPNFWRDNTMGLTLMAKIDGGTTYQLMGAPGAVNATETSLQITATQSVFTFQAGPVAVTADFLSPVEADDLRRLSMPLGDITLTAHSTDGATHHVQLYCDIGGEWAYGDTTGVIRWNPETIARSADGSGTQGSLQAWELSLNAPTPLNEIDQYPTWGTQVLATAAQSGLTSQSGPAGTVRGQFINTGVLTGTNDTNQPRTINSNFPTFAFSQDEGTVGSGATAPFTLLLGHPTAPAVSYHGTALSPLWQTYWPTYEGMFAFACNDEAGAQARAGELDAQIADAATQIGGQDYAALCDLSLRQAFAGTELVSNAPNAAIGQSSEPMMFMKEISSSGSAGDVSTVDVIYPSMPAFLYTNPTLLRLLLEPLIAYGEATNPATNAPYFNQPYSVHDLGGNYPVASGHDDGGGETMPVEESANMLIMADAYMRFNANKATSTAYAQQHYAIFRKWANYLLTVPTGATRCNALDPPSQLSSDDFDGSIAHSVNLALKGIEGIGAMGQIAQQAGNTSDATYYTQQAQQLIAQWASLAQSPQGNHLLLQYLEPDDTAPNGSAAAGDWSMIYNSLPDKLLGLNLIPSSVATEEINFYRSLEQPYGVPLDSRDLNFDWGDGPYSPPHGPLGKLDWELFTAAGLGDGGLRQDMTNEIYHFANTTPDLVPFDDDYDTATGNKGNFVARSVVGAEFAPLVVAAGPFPNPNLFYRIVNQFNGLLVAVNTMSQADGATVTQWNDNGTPDHNWKFLSSGSGQYRLLNQNSAKVLTPLNYNKNDSAGITQWDDNGTGDHLWQILPNVDGSYRVNSLFSGKDLTPTGYSTALGTPLTQWDDNGTYDHNWYFWPVF